MNSKDKKIYMEKYNKIWRERNREKKKLMNREYYLKNREIIIKRQKEYSLKNKEKIKRYKKEYFIKNKDKVDLYQKKYHKINEDKISEQKRQYNFENKDKITLHKRNKRKTDILYKFKTDIRCLIKESFKRKSYKKNIKTEHVLGCTLEEFRIYIENQLPEGKSIRDLGRYGYHIDHIIPLSTAKTVEDVVKLCHYSNLRPLFWKDNLSKGHKTTEIGK